MMEGLEHETVNPVQRDVSAVVKWFNPSKGFGFVQFGDGSPDAFLHVSVVEQSGLGDVAEGTKLVCDISEGRKGPQVAIIRRIESYGAPEMMPRAPSAHPRIDIADPGGEVTDGVEGRVKFFNAEKGFGFVCPEDGGKDVYVSLRTLQRTGMTSLEPNQRVRLSIRMGQKGPMADRLEIL